MIPNVNSREEPTTSHPPFKCINNLQEEITVVRRRKLIVIALVQSVEKN